MAVFDGSVKTPRQVADPKTDKRISSVASIVLQTINTPTALLYPGSDVSVVHGEQWLQVDRNRIMKVGMNQDVTIGMNENYLVDINRTMTVMGNYTRDVMANSLINVTGSYTKNVTSDYTKIIMANYLKSIAVNSTIDIGGISIVNYAGRHRQTFGSDSTTYIAGTNTHTTVGPTICTEIGPTVTQQIDNHLDAHPSNLNEEKNSWFTVADKKGTWQKFLKLDYTSGLYCAGSILKLDVNAATYGVNGTTNAIFVEKMDCGFNKNEIGVAKDKWHGVSMVAAGVTAKAAVNSSKAVVATAHAGAASVKFLGGQFKALGAEIIAGIINGFNQIF